MVDHEQPLPHQHSVTNTLPNTRQLPDSSLDDTASTEKVNEAVASKEAEDESKDQNKGGLGAYFVSV